MFGFSRRRMKLGRLKVQLSDSAQGAKSPIIHSKRSNSDDAGVAPVAIGSDELNCPSSSATTEVNSASGNSESWMVLSISGDKPAPRSDHAATVIGHKMLVVGGESGTELLEDVQVLNFDSFSWTPASSKLYLSPTNLPLKIPACKGHCLISWGQKVLLIGGKTYPASDRLSVWSFDTETECWSLVESKGDIPVARSGHTVVRANSALIVFGGEDAKRRKLNDLHMFDLKSMTWLPLNCIGPGPSPRSSHVGAIYDDRILLIFGGSSKSRTLNDLYSLDFETMVWSRIKTRGFHPSPRSGCCGVLCGTKWYIVGGGSKKKRHAETLVFDVIKVEWTLAISSPSASIVTNTGFSLVLMQHRDKNFLVAFGGYRRDSSNQVEALTIEKTCLSMDQHSTPKKAPGILLSSNHASASGLASQVKTAAAKKGLISAIDHGSGRKSLSETLLLDQNSVPVNIPVHGQFQSEEEQGRSIKLPKSLEDQSSLLQTAKNRSKQLDIGPHSVVNIGEMSTVLESESLGDDVNIIVPDNVFSLESDGKSGSQSGICQLYESKMAALIRRNGILEGRLAAATANLETAEKSSSAALNSRQEMEKKLSDTVKEMEFLEEKLATIVAAQEESGSLSNIVHSDNVRLEHDVAFLKAVLDDTQKELHTTRGVLAGERARGFQLQVEVFHLKQRMHAPDNRTPTPRKTFPV